MVKGKVKVLVLRTAGTNCDRETAFAFEKYGAAAKLVHVNRLVRGEERLSEHHILAIPGGFTYGDDIASGKVLANELKNKLSSAIHEFIGSGRLIIGICNGFQVLVKSGILPGTEEASSSDYDSQSSAQATLTLNESDKFEARWVYLKPGSKSKCVWTKGISGIIYLPVAHGEGNFVTRDKQILNRIKNNGQVVLRYTNACGKIAPYPYNPNGSQDDIAGICDTTGRVFGLMPHPERHIAGTHHPRWMREGIKKEGDGASIFRNGVNYAKRNL